MAENGTSLVFQLHVSSLENLIFMSAICHWMRKRKQSMKSASGYQMGWDDFLENFAKVGGGEGSFTYIYPSLLNMYEDLWICIRLARLRKWLSAKSQMYEVIQLLFWFWNSYLFSCISFHSLICGDPWKLLLGWPKTFLPLSPSSVSGTGDAA